MGRKRRLKLRLKELREENDYSVEELATILHCRAGQIIDWENCSIIPSVRRIIQIAKHFECSTDYLLGLTDEPDPYEPSEAYDDDEYEEVDSEETEENEEDAKPEKKGRKILLFVAVALIVLFILAQV